MTLHRIRLRHPWRAEGCPEGVRWRRAFHRPTGLGPRSRVWLVVEGAPGPGHALLNGCVLGDLSPEVACRFDVTAGLRDRNEVEIVLPAAAPGPELAASMPAEVGLEIEEHGLGG